MMKQLLSAASLGLAISAFAQTPCVDGFAGGYPCSGLDLLSVRTLEELGGGANGNDCWGWVDPSSQREFVLFGRHDGLSIVDVTDAVNPTFVGRVPTATTPSLWRDVKVHNNHAFIVSEAANHGMQVVDLTQVLEVTEGPEVLTPVASYIGFGNAHNIAINEQTGFAFAVGTNTAGGGLHAIDISNPAAPSVAGTNDGPYTHDAQVVLYDGPDTDYAGKEVAFCFNGSGGVAIVDVTDKSDMVQVAAFNYSQSAYTHQGWLSEDGRFLYFNDELDESNYGNGTRTYIADVSDLDAPVVIGFYEADNTSVDHNLYVRGNKIFASNYLSGLRVSEIGPNGSLTPYAYFDTNPDTDSVAFYGTWSNYPYFPSGNIAISCRSVGLFMVSDPTYDPTNVGQLALDETTLNAYPNPAQSVMTLEGMPRAAFVRVVNALGQEVVARRAVPGLTGLSFDIGHLAEGMHVVHAETKEGQVQSVQVLIQR